MVGILYRNILLAFGPFSGGVCCSFWGGYQTGKRKSSLFGLVDPMKFHQSEKESESGPQFDWNQWGGIASSQQKVASKYQIDKNICEADGSYDHCFSHHLLNQVVPITKKLTIQKHPFLPVRIHPRHTGTGHHTRGDRNAWVWPTGGIGAWKRRWSDGQGYPAGNESISMYIIYYLWIHYISVYI